MERMLRVGDGSRGEPLLRKKASAGCRQSKFPEIDGSPVVAAQRRRLQQLFGDALNGFDERLPGRQTMSAALPACARPVAVTQLTKWLGKEWSTLKMRKGGVLVFTNAEDAKRALMLQFSEEEQAFLKAGDWDSCAEKATQKEADGIEGGYRLAMALVNEGRRKKEAAERRQKIEDDGLKDAVDNWGFGVLATAAVKKGIDMYPSGALNGSLGEVFAVATVNSAISELNGVNELDDAGHVAIRDVHKVSDKGTKMSIDRLSRYQANVNMSVYGAVKQVHIDADRLQ